MIVHSQQQGPTYIAGGFTPFQNADITADHAIYTVTAFTESLATDITAESDGWTKLGQVPVRAANLQGVVERAQQATFQKDSAGADETLVILSTQNGRFSGSLLRFTAA